MKTKAAVAWKAGEALVEIKAAGVNDAPPQMMGDPIELRRCRLQDLGDRAACALLIMSLAAAYLLAGLYLGSVPSIR